MAFVCPDPDRYNSLVGVGGTVRDRLGVFFFRLVIIYLVALIGHCILRGEGQQLGNLGTAYRSLGQYDKAIEKYNAALVISREIGDRRMEGNSLCGLGIAYHSLGEYDKAIEMHNAAIIISREIGDRNGEGKSLGNLGNAFYSLGQYNKANEMHNAALVIKREIGDRQGEGTSLGSLGIAYYCLGEHQRAILSLKDALAITCDIGDRQGEMAELHNLSLCHFELEEYDIAKEYLEKSIWVSDAIWSDLRRDEDRITYDDGDMQKSSRWLQRVHSKLGQQEKALECAERARSRAFELLLVQQRTQGGTTSSESPISPPSVEAVDVSSIRELAVCQRSAIITFSQVSDDTILVWVVGSDPIRQLFAKSIHVRSEDDSPIRLSQLVEMTRRSLRAPPRKGRNSDSRSPPHNIGESLAQPSVDEDELYASAAKCAESSDGTTPTLNQMRSAFSPPSSDQLRPDRVREDPGGEEQQLQNMASRKLLRHCYKLFVEPLLPAVSGESGLIIVPDRDLYALPFAALIGGDGKHLVEHFSIRLAPSVGTLVELENRMGEQEVSRAAGHVKSDTVNSALIVGNPDFNGWFDQLPGSQWEAEEVNFIMEGTACSPLLIGGGDATKDRIMAEMHSSDIIHLATHGTGNGIYLSGKTKEEGKLSMAEVQELKLAKAGLVVLSACDTFNGELRADGVIGISRAFVAAGAPALVATLWVVSDNATHTFMSRFYRRLFTRVGGVVDVGMALQEVMISMIQDESFEVREWAPFIVYGLPMDFEKYILGEGNLELQHEMEGLLSSCRLLVDKKYENILPIALEWCKDNGMSHLSEIVAGQHEEEFADELGLARIKRKILIKHLKKL